MGRVTLSALTAHHREKPHGATGRRTFPLTASPHRTAANQGHLRRPQFLLQSLQVVFELLGMPLRRRPGASLALQRSRQLGDQAALLVKVLRHTR